jgi:hypothetical protein
MHSRIDHNSASSSATMTLAQRMGTTPHISPLLMKAGRIGLKQPEDLEKLAVHRGLRYYDSYGDTMSLPHDQAGPSIIAKEDSLSNEELALALISPATPYSLQRLRMSAAMIGAQGNKPETIAFLAKRERSEPIVRHIAQCGSQAEPNNPFWKKLLALLPQTPAPAIDVLPHLTRFVAMTGLTRAGKGNRMQWIRPTRTLTP